MSKRRGNVLLGVASLMLGGFIYAIFRENTFIAKHFEQLDYILRLRKLLSFCSNDFLKYYFPDFLWGFSLCCGLHAIYEPQVRGSLVCGFTSLLCGIAWELLQYWDFVGGTGDFVDIIMYLLASCTCIIINLKERKKMKKTKILLSLLLVFIFAFMAIGSGETSDGEQGNVEQGRGEVEATEQASNTSIGDYSVVIDSCRLATDWEGKPVVIVKYIYTNVANDNATSFAAAFDEVVYQNGVGLNESWAVDESANYSMDNQTKEIKKGASLDVEVAYELNDTTTDIEVEVKELFSFDDTTITKMFSIAQ